MRLPVLDSRDDIARDLDGLVDGEVRFGHHDRMLYATDASIYQVEPLGVVVPRHITDVEAVVRYCGRHGIPLLPRGGGTALAGQTVNRAVVLDLSAHCRALLSVDREARTARIEPGIVLDHFNAQLAPEGLMFGPDVATSSHANLGGMIGNNSAGAHSILFGRTVDNLRGLDVVLAGGERLRLEQGAATSEARVAELTRQVTAIVRPLATEIRRRFPRTRRRVDGYNLDLLLDQVEASSADLEEVNLAHLVCGSEGTLATVVEAELTLVPRPARTALAIAGFASIDDALASLATILETGPAAVELVDDTIIDLAGRNVEYRRYVDLMPKPARGELGAVLYVEYFADDDDALADRCAVLADRLPGVPLRRFDDAAEMANAWKLRKAGEPLLHAMPGRRKPVTFVEDTAVDPARLPEFVRAFRALVDRHGSRAAYYAHASVGCLHIRPLICLADPDDRVTMERITRDVTDLVIEFEGALSGEHGDGRVRSPWLERFYGRQICDAFRAIKEIFDPRNLMNPGNIVEPGPMSDHLRVRPNDDPVEVPAMATHFRYEREHGFAEAVQMCNGAGICRRTGPGTMCPSYRATRDERHATRGRGNALRLAITGQLGDRPGVPSWDDPDTLETLDLCLSCKACKSECPSNVDISKLKAEYLAMQYAEAGRVPLKARAFGHVRALNRAGAAAPRLANAIANLPPARALAGQLLGLDPRRSLPAFAPPLDRWHAARPDARRDGPAVILFPDCFTTYNEPHVGRAAITALEALGYRVVMPAAGCCGRSLISTGLLADARRTVEATATALLDAVRSEDAIAIVGCEPSCISAIRDDWRELDTSLDPGRLDDLAQRTRLVEEFVEEHWTTHPRAPAPNTSALPERALLHGHCHQKALWGVETSASALHRVLGDRLDVLETGCCGMAGSFGYTRDHYELSMAIGELGLLPAVRGAPDATIIAPGTSCRQQIADGTGRVAVHPVEVLARVLGG